MLIPADFNLNTVHITLCHDLFSNQHKEITEYIYKGVTLTSYVLLQDHIYSLVYFDVYVKNIADLC